MFNESFPEPLPPGVPGPLPGRLLGIDADGSATRVVLVTGGSARGIVRAAAGHLASLAGAIQRVLGPLPVSGLGGALSAPASWAASADLTGAVRPIAPPEVGAALLAGAPQAAFARQPGATLAVPVARVLAGDGRA